MDIGEWVSNLSRSSNPELFDQYFKHQASLFQDKKGLLIMNRLCSEDEVGLSVLQKDINLSQYKFYEELARLEGALFIEYRKDPDDKRLVKVKITPIGRYVTEHYFGGVTVNG